MVSANDDKIPNTQRRERSIVRFAKANETCGGSSDPRKCNWNQPPSGLTACPGSGPPAMVDGWQNLPTRVPNWAHEPGVLISYKTSESTGSSSLILRNTLAAAAISSGHTSAQVILSHNDSKDKPHLP